MTILDRAAETIDEAKDYRNELFSVKDDFSEVIFDLTWDLLIPELKKFANRHCLKQS